MRNYLLIIFSIFTVNSAFSQDFSKKDSLRGNLTTFRTCYDVTFYNLNVIIDEKERFIERSFNEISFIVKSDFQTLQIDLALNMEILLIQFEEQELDYTREFDAVFIDFPRLLKAGEESKIKVWYDGYPRKAVNAPWDGGFS